jgi:hypothetical protein
MLLWRCHHRSITLLIADIVSSLLLLWTLFYEQYSDKILLKIKFYLQQKVEEEEETTEIRRKTFSNEKFIIVVSFQSLVFILQVLFASLSFIATLLAYEHKGI